MRAPLCGCGVACWWTTSESSEGGKVPGRGAGAAADRSGQKSPRKADGDRMEETSILSVGIDIGTTTTQMIFSSLRLRNTAGPTQAPRYAITGRSVVWGSPVVFTPKKTGGDASPPASGASTSGHKGQGTGCTSDLIDESALGTMIDSWYAEAGIARQDVTTGAIIITGESLKSANARRAVMRLSDSLGDFVVASAGPHLESVIAGRGSGAAALSQRLSGTVLNIDIGGGTSNYAVFRSGAVIDTACVNIGGRLVETTSDGRVMRLLPPGRIIAEETFGRTPDPIGPEHLDAMADAMADTLYDLALGVNSPLARRLLQTPPLQEGRRYDAVTVSGGVGECCQRPGGNPFRFGDIGPLLAEALLRNPNFRRLPLRPPASTVRATVIGAGSWSLSLSGSTVWAEEGAFPLRNVPVVTVPVERSGIPADLAAHIRSRLLYFDIDTADDAFALAFGGLPPTYAAVCYLAEGIERFQRALPKRPLPVIIALKEDMGKALGMELKPRLPGSPLIVIDEVDLAEGDYLDLGKPLQAGGFVPLIIKSLAFSGENGSIDFDNISLT